MPLDSVFLSGLAGELSETVTGAKIDKVQQPERDALMVGASKVIPQAVVVVEGGEALLFEVGHHAVHAVGPSAALASRDEAGDGVFRLALHEIVLHAPAPPRDGVFKAGKEEAVGGEKAA